MSTSRCGKICIIPPKYTRNERRRNFFSRCGIVVATCPGDAVCFVAKEKVIIIIIICYIYIALFLVLKALYIERGDLHNHHQCVASTMNDATAAILRQNAHHTPAYWWRGDRMMKPISVWGWLGGLDGQRPMGKFGQYAGVTPLLFFEGYPGIFNDHRESGCRFNISSEGRCFLQYSVPVTILWR